MSLHHVNEEMRRLSLILLPCQFGNCEILFILEKSVREKPGGRMYL